MVFVTRRQPRRSLLGAILGAGLLLSLLPLSASAGSAAGSLPAQADSLWNQPQGTRPDSAFYVIQVWWDGLTRATARDRYQKGLQELSQANADLLNAYSLLQEQRTDPGPHPVAVIDPLLSGAYGFITGVHVKAPIGSMFGWINDGLVHLQGRGSTDTIVRSLLHDYQSQRAAAVRDLSPDERDPVWTANAAREIAMLTRIGALGGSSLGVSSLIAATSPANRPSPTAVAATAKPSPRSSALSKAKPTGKEKPTTGTDERAKQKGHNPEGH
ncbi:MAG TPA: hypothetical protein VGD57_08420 [Candidatus Dormibacteraeota bacterium]